MGCTCMAPPLWEVGGGGGLPLVEVLWFAGGASLRGLLLVPACGGGGGAGGGYGAAWSAWRIQGMQVCGWCVDLCCWCSGWVAGLGVKCGLPRRSGRGPCVHSGGGALRGRGTGSLAAPEGAGGGRHVSR